MVNKPDIEFRRNMKGGFIRSYGHIYFSPFIVVILGKVLIGKKHLT